MSFGKMIHLRLLLLSDEKIKKSALHFFGSDRGAASAIKLKRMEIGPGSLSPTIGPLINMKVFIAFSLQKIPSFLVYLISFFFHV